MVMHRGGCHCRRIRFEVEAPEELSVSECNCSICSMTGFLHLLVPKTQFKLLAGQDDLSSYRFNTGTAQHLFCRVCGVKSFYVPRSHPHAYSVNARCLDPGTVRDMHVAPFDGANFEQHVDELPPV